MKETIKHYFPFVMTVLSAVMAISILFANINSIGELFSTQKTNNYATTITEQINSLNNESLPLLTYNASALAVGDANILKELFSLKFADGNMTTIANSSDASLYLVDIKNQNNTSVLSKFSSDDIAAMETYPSKAIYDTEQDLLYFQDSGIYTFLIRLHFRHHKGILYECKIPVETR